jgi:hypothetical protein
MNLFLLSKSSGVHQLMKVVRREHIQGKKAKGLTPNLTSLLPYSPSFKKGLYNVISRLWTRGGTASVHQQCPTGNSLPLHLNEQSMLKTEGITDDTEV